MEIKILALKHAGLLFSLLQPNQTLQTFAL